MSIQCGKGNGLTIDSTNAEILNWAYNNSHTRPVTYIDLANPSKPGQRCVAEIRWCDLDKRVTRFKEVSL